MILLGKSIEFQLPKDEVNVAIIFDFCCDVELKRVMIESERS